jgi:hypothetical protein
MNGNESLDVPEFTSQKRTFGAIWLGLSRTLRGQGPS